MVPPLAAALFNTRDDQVGDDVVVWLLSHGADPNGPFVMFNGARWSSITMLQLLIDAGGDVNRNSSEMPPCGTSTTPTCGCCCASISPSRTAAAR